MKYTVKNFKIFDEKGATFEIAPITLLTGCNCSGKSSLVKSMMILNDFFVKVKSHKSDAFNDGCLDVFKIPIDFALGVKDIGGFDNVINDKNTNGQITFQYTVSSKLLKEDVVVTLVFVREEKSISHRNGHLKEISFQRADGTLFYVADVFAGTHRYIDFSVLHDSFLDLVWESIFYIIHQHKFEDKNHNPDWDPPYETTEEHLLRNDSDKTNKQKEDEIWSSRYDILSSSDNSPVEEKIPGGFWCSLRDLLTDESCSNDEIVALKKYRTLFYSPLLKMLDGVEKKQVRKVFDSLLKDADVGDEFKTGLDFILRDYEGSNFVDFIDYYLNKEKQQLIFGGPSSDDVSNTFLRWSASSMKMKTYITGVSIDGSEQSLCGILFKPEYFSDVINAKKIDMGIIFSGLSYLYSKINPEYKVMKELKIIGYDSSPLFYKNRIYYCMQEFFKFLWKELLVDAVPSCMTDLHYVGPTRATVQRLYSFDDEKSELNKNVRAYFNLKSDFSKEFNAFKNREKYYVELHRSTEQVVRWETEINDAYQEIDSFMSRWLKKMELCESFCINPVCVDGASLGYSISLMKNGVSHSIADEGYGCVQVFSVLLAIQNALYQSVIDEIIGNNQFKFYKNKYVIAIEEPENHLHPKLQSLLADVLYEANEIGDVHFLIETHSEYLIRKSQVLVKKWYEENKDKDKECPFQAYYIPSGGTPYSMGYRQDGKFAESFGPGFYDESANLTFEIM